jgi:hypothetical protein
MFLKNGGRNVPLVANKSNNIAAASQIEGENNPDLQDGERRWIP